MPDDPYEVLGLTKAALADDIKKAYRKLVRTSHPDLHPDDAGAEARFKAISAAYEILKVLSEELGVRRCIGLASLRP